MKGCDSTATSLYEHTSKIVLTSHILVILDKVVNIFVKTIYTYNSTIFRVIEINN